MALALRTLGNLSGQTLQYRTTPTGGWLALADSLLQQDQPVPIGYDEARNVIMAAQTARLKITTAGVHLTPGVGGAQVKDQIGTVWSVVGIDHAVGQSIYLLQRTVIQSQGAARGTVP
jgi:hypothetical protein